MEPQSLTPVTVILKPYVILFFLIPLRTLKVKWMIHNPNTTFPQNEATWTSTKQCKEKLSDFHFRYVLNALHKRLFQITAIFMIRKRLTHKLHS